ncbi:hypothetical protein EG329_013842 [Mollisiaceae sp. DMI_Dod_QoI]|nr:hypothetical protein EG329_013842 [Helotiales sp. DMI_Dod_QoI]
MSDTSSERPQKRLRISSPEPTLDNEANSTAKRVSVIIDKLVKKYKKDLVLEDVSTDDADMELPLPRKYPKKLEAQIKTILEAEHRAHSEKLRPLRAEREDIWRNFQAELKNADL